MCTSGGPVFTGPTSYFAPLIVTPMTDLSANAIHSRGTHCEQFEKNFFDCVAAFGVVLSKRKCDLEYRDYYECLYERKQVARYYMIQRERKKQFLLGKRDRVTVKESPGVFVPYPDYFDHNDYIPFREN